MNQVQHFMVGMKFLRIKTLQDACRFNCRISKLFGYFYFSLNRDEKSEHELEVFVKFLLYVVVGFLISVKSSEVDVGQSSNSFIVNLGVRILIKQTLYMPTVFRIYNFFVRRQHAEIFMKLQSIDNELVKMGIDFNYRRHHLMAIAITSSYYIFLCIVFFVDNFLSSRYLNIDKIDFTAALLAAFNVASYLSYQISHMMINDLIYRRLRAMNRVLTRFTLNQKFIKKIASIHGNLCDTLDLVNKSFAINLLSYSFQFTIFCIFYFFGFYHYMTSPEASFKEFILNVISTMYFLLFLWFGTWIVTVSSWIKSEGSLTKAIIHSKVIASPGILKSLNDFCLQMDQIKPRISCGLFIVDWTFLLSFIGTLFTYLIILIQFEIK